jgi:putative endonuclease
MCIISYFPNLPKLPNFIVSLRNAVLSSKIWVVVDNWSVYLVECSDGTLYTGISNDVKKRVWKHNNKLGAVSVRGKLPVKLVYQELIGTKSEAAKREYAIKHWTREYKLKLIEKYILKSQAFQDKI